MVRNPRLGNVILESSDVHGERGFKGSIVLAGHPFVG